MEIACLVTVKIPATFKNIRLAEKYLELAKEHKIWAQNSRKFVHVKYFSLLIRTRI